MSDCKYNIFRICLNLFSGLLFLCINDSRTNTFFNFITRLFWIWRAPSFKPRWRHYVSLYTYINIYCYILTANYLKIVLQNLNKYIVHMAATPLLDSLNEKKTWYWLLYTNIPFLFQTLLNHWIQTIIFFLFQMKMLWGLGLLSVCFVVQNKDFDLGTKLHLNIIIYLNWTTLL